MSAQETLINGLKIKYQNLEFPWVKLCLIWTDYRGKVRNLEIRGFFPKKYIHKVSIYSFFFYLFVLKHHCIKQARYSN